MTNGKWHEIWEKREADEKELKSRDVHRVFMELKRIAGWDSVNTRGGGMTRSVLRMMSFIPNIYKLRMN